MAYPRCHSNFAGYASIRVICCLWMVLAVLPVAGCSAEQAYRSVQHSKLQECQRLPIWQQEHCMSLYDTPYPEYRRELEQIETDQTY